MFTFKCFLPYVCQQLGSLGGDLHVLRMTALIQFYKIIPDPTNGKDGRLVPRQRMLHFVGLYRRIKDKGVLPIKNSIFYNICFTFAIPPLLFFDFA